MGTTICFVEYMTIWVEAHGLEEQTSMTLVRLLVDIVWFTDMVYRWNCGGTENWGC